MDPRRLDEEVDRLEGELFRLVEALPKNHPIRTDSQPIYAEKFRAILQDEGFRNLHPSVMTELMKRLPPHTSSTCVEVNRWMDESRRRGSSPGRHDRVYASRSPPRNVTLPEWPGRGTAHRDFTNSDSEPQRWRHRGLKPVPRSPGTGDSLSYSSPSPQYYRSSPNPGSRSPTHRSPSAGAGTQHRGGGGGGDTLRHSMDSMGGSGAVGSSSVSPQRHLMLSSGSSDQIGAATQLMQRLNSASLKLQGKELSVMLLMKDELSTGRLKVSAMLDVMYELKEDTHSNLHLLRMALGGSESIPYVKWVYCMEKGGASAEKMESSASTATVKAPEVPETAPSGARKAAPASKEAEPKTSPTTGLSSEQEAALVSMGKLLTKQVDQETLQKWSQSLQSKELQFLVSSMKAEEKSQATAKPSGLEISTTSLPSLPSVSPTSLPSSIIPTSPDQKKILDTDVEIASPVAKDKGKHLAAEEAARQKAAETTKQTPGLGAQELPSPSLLEIMKDMKSIDEFISLIQSQTKEKETAEKKKKEEAGAETKKSKIEEEEDKKTEKPHQEKKEDERKEAPIEEKKEEPAKEEKKEAAKEEMKEKKMEEQVKEEKEVAKVETKEEEKETTKEEKKEAAKVETKEEKKQEPAKEEKKEAAKVETKEDKKQEPAKEEKKEESKSATKTPEKENKPRENKASSKELKVSTGSELVKVIHKSMDKETKHTKYTESVMIMEKGFKTSSKYGDIWRNGADAAKDEGPNAYNDSFSGPVAIGMSIFSTLRGPVTWVSAKDMKRLKSVPSELPNSLRRELQRDFNKPHCLFHGIDPSDVAQGAIGNCGFIAAVACLAEFPQVIENIFSQDSKSLDSREYDLKLYDPKMDFSSAIVRLNDKVPCFAQTFKEGEWMDWKPCFCRAIQNESWPYLVEKGVAKLLGSYASLNGTPPCLAWAILSGITEYKIYFPWDTKTPWLVKNGDITEADVKKYKDKWGIGQFEPHLTEYTYSGPGDIACSTDEVWKRVMEVVAECICACSFRPITADGSDAGQGLVAFHCYSIIGVDQVGDIRLVQLRNPWGDDREWTGAWSDNCENWMKQADVTVKLGYGHRERKPDGMFFMSWEDFTARANEIVFGTDKLGRKTGSSSKRVIEPGAAQTKHPDLKSSTPRGLTKSDTKNLNPKNAYEVSKHDSLTSHVPTLPLSTTTTPDHGWMHDALAAIRGGIIKEYPGRSGKEIFHSSLVPLDRCSKDEAPLIDHVRFFAIVSKYQPHLSPRHIEQIWRFADKDADGGLTYQEFENTFKMQ